MRQFGIAIVALVIGCCVLSTAAEEEKKCVPGSRFRDAEDCNWCWCGNDGVTVSCTKKKCIKLDLETESRVKRQTGDRVCEPGSRYKDADDCNWCTCNKDGTAAACTRKFCHKPRPVTPAQPKKCTPGESFLSSDGCNTCFCNDDGTEGGCTERLCLENVDKALSRQLRSVPDGMTCEPGSRFRDADGCNWCTCSSDGKMAACTRKFCIPKHRPDRVARASGAFCTPGSTFKKDCNTCHCSSDGRNAACTFKYCLPDEGRVRRDVEEKKVCEPNSVFRDAEDCNNCFCNEKGTAAACTLKLCIKSNKPFTKSLERAKRDAAQVCKPNTTFKQDCNTCWCNEEGSAAACTLIGCLSSPPDFLSQRTRRQSPKQVKICTPNEIRRAQDSCNSCKCNEEGTAWDCTEVVCPALAGLAPAVCTPNSVFKQDCNTCKCSSSGDRAFCTRRLCRSTRDTNENEEKDKEVTAQPTPCTPDDIKIEGCNRCKCAKNGIVWLCTPGSACPPNGNGNGNSNH